MARIDREVASKIPTPEQFNDLPGIVSVDDHVVEPPHLWIDRLAAKYRETAPHVVRKMVPQNLHSEVETVEDRPRDDSFVPCDVWYYGDVRFPVRRNMCAAGLSPEESIEISATFDEFRPGAYDAKARLEDMDLDGITASVLFPDSFVRFCGQLFLQAKDHDLALLFVRAYNDWLYEEWASPSGGRLIPGAILPLWSTEESVREVKRNANRGFRALCFSEIPSFLGLPSLHSGEWDGLFTACEETGTTILMHIGSSSVVRSRSMDAPMSVELCNLYINSSLSLSDWLMSGLFDRFPGLRIVYSEAQAGWIPYIVSRLDGMWLRIPDDFVQLFRLNPYTRFGVFVHLVKGLSQPLA